MSAAGIVPASTLEGLPIHTSGRIHVDAEYDVEEVKRQRQQQQLAPAYPVGPESNLDIIIREPLFTLHKVTNSYNSSDMSRRTTLKVLSSFNGAGAELIRAGMRDEEETIRMALLARAKFAGFALDTKKFDIKQTAGFSMPKLATQVAGLITLNCGGLDFPFGAHVRFDIPKYEDICKRGSAILPDGSGPGKVRLIPVPETDGKPFAKRTLHGMRQFLEGPNYFDGAFDPSNPRNTAAKTAYGALARNALVNFILVARVVREQQAKADRDAAADARARGVAPPAPTAFFRISDAELLQIAAAFGLFDNALSDGGIEAARACFIDPQKNFNLMFGAAAGGGRNPYIQQGSMTSDYGGKMLKLQIQSADRMLAAQCELLRLYHEWVPMRVVKNGRAGRTFDALFG